MNAAARTVLALSGGVGGAKLALGLADELPPGQLYVLVNTGDDFDHLGLHITPDIDTVLYTLSGLADTTQGWGLAGESWQAMSALERLGGETWFRLGDRDLATHLWRTQRLAGGASLSEVTVELQSRLGVESHVYPMSDEPVHTIVHTATGDLPFQHYFVRDQCAPTVNGFSFEGITAAHPNRQVLQQLRADAFDAVVICPSNPYVSVDPILQIPGLWTAVRDCTAPVIVVCPIVAGRAIKGPAAKMMGELGVPVTASGVAAHYCQRYPGLVTHFVIDEGDAELADSIRDYGVEVVTTQTLMHSREDKQLLARAVLAIGGDD